MPSSTPIVPQYRVIGDYWSFGVQFVDPATGLPVPITSSLVPGAEFYQAYNTSPPLDLTVANGLVTVTDAANGKVAFVVPAVATLDAVPQRVPSPGLPQTYPTRLHCFLTDRIGRQTYVIAAIVPIDPKSTDLATIPPATTIIAYAGPAGPKGDPGEATLPPAPHFDPVGDAGKTYGLRVIGGLLAWVVLPDLAVPPALSLDLSTNAFFH